MKYKLKDLCSITKGATGIMKADGGKYPLVALSDERRSHSEYQFDAKAVIVPLISSTGHGHASMKRVHYQEGKFALGNILCAVIPNDEKQLHPKYLHLYLQQFKDSLLVPLMKGAANVSLPMNKLADVEIEVPSLERQLEIIELEDEAAELKNELEERLIAQDGDVAKLRLAFLKEAFQGKLTKQTLESGQSLLEQIKKDKQKLIDEKSIKTEKGLPEIKSKETPHSIPSNWVWCRLGEICLIEMGQSPEGSSYNDKGKGVPLINGPVEFGGMGPFDTTVKTKWTTQPTKYCKKGDLLICVRGSTTGRTNIAAFDACIGRGVAAIRPINFAKFIHYYIQLQRVNIFGLGKGSTFPNISQENLTFLLIPLPPLKEQIKIVDKIEQLMQLCDELQYSIQQSKIENEKLLQGALRDALKKEEVEV